jgi:hypothetical protein
MPYLLHGLGPPPPTEAADVNAFERFADCVFEAPRGRVIAVCLVVYLVVYLAGWAGGAGWSV